MNDVNIVQQRAETILSDGINNNFLSFCVILPPQFGNLSYNVYVTCVYFSSSSFLPHVYLLFNCNEDVGNKRQIKET